MGPRSTKQGDDLDSELVVAGNPPAMRPPRVVDYEELDKKAIDILVDSLKYVATSSGIVIAMYAPTLREYVKLPELSARPLAQLLAFAPLLLWFMAIVGTVLGIFPRDHVAVTDAEKELAFRRIRREKMLWVRLVLVPFLCGFGLFVYLIAAQIWRLYPFR